MKDLVFFVCFILVFLLGFSITSWSFIISPTQVKWMYDSQGQLEDVTISDDPAHTWSWKLLRDMTNYGVWKVFGQVDIVGKSSFWNEPCPRTISSVFVQMATIYTRQWSSFWLSSSWLSPMFSFSTCSSLSSSKSIVGRYSAVSNGFR